MPNRLTELPNVPLSPLVLLLEGLGKTALGMGLLLERAATVVERRTASLPQGNVAAVTSLRPVAALDKAVA